MGNPSQPIGHRDAAGTGRVCLLALVCLFGVSAPRVAAQQLDSGGLFENGDGPINTADQKVKVGSFGQVDLHVKDLEVSRVLQLLSIQSQRNIIASRNVAGSISADLYDVDFYEALDAILHTNGFGYHEKGNLIFVYTTSELEAIQEAERKMAHRVVRLSYITASDASTFVTPLLSADGSITVSGETTPGFAPSIADGGANSFANTDTLIIHDYPEIIDEIVEVIKDLDQRPKQVLVEATILQARLSEDNAFGVDLSILADFAINTFTDPLGVVDEMLGSVIKPTEAAGGLQTTVGNTGPASTSGAKIGIVTHNVAAFIKALDQVTDTTVMANPKLLVLNRQRADLLVGEKLGYISTTATDTSTTQTVEFLEIGTQLTFRPFVSDDGFIRLELKPSISDGTTRETASGSVIPETTNQELTTNVVVRNGQTVVLGGLFKEDTTVSRRQVPGLGDVPLLGVMFKGQEDDVERNEVIFLITPTIVKDQSLYAEGDAAQHGAEMARLGAREGLLPWSKTKLTAAHIRDAQEHFNHGDKKKALWSTNMALTLNPRAADAIRLKEKLTGRHIYRPSVDFRILRDTADDIIQHRVDNTPRRVAPPKTMPWPLEPSGAPGFDAGSSFNPKTPAPQPVAPTAPPAQSTAIAPPPAAATQDQFVSPQDTAGFDDWSTAEVEDDFSSFDADPAVGGDPNQEAQPWLKSFFQPQTAVDSVDQAPPAVQEDDFNLDWEDETLTPEIEFPEDPAPQDAADSAVDADWHEQQADQFEFVEEVQPLPATDTGVDADWPEPSEVQFEDQPEFTTDFDPGEFETLPEAQLDWQENETTRNQFEDSFEDEAGLTTAVDPLPEFETDWQQPQDPHVQFEDESLIQSATDTLDESEFDWQTDSQFNDEFDDQPGFNSDVTPLPEADLDWQDSQFPESGFDQDIQATTAIDSMVESDYFPRDEVVELDFDDDSAVIDALVPSAVVRENQFESTQISDDIEHADAVPATDPFNAVVEWLLPEDMPQQK